MCAASIAGLLLTLFAATPATGKLASVAYALGNTTGYAYDAANRKTQTTYPDGTASQFGYDAAGRKTSTTDPVGRTTSYAYDADGRLRQVTDALGAVTSYGYDELGDKTRQTDALGHVTSWAYGKLGRATKHTLPDNRTQSMAYDAVGRLASKTDFAGNTTDYQYDKADRPTQASFADGTAIATSYSDAGRIQSRTLVGSSTQTIHYTYDSRDRLTDLVNPDGSSLHYQYDAAGQKTSETITTPDGQSTQIAYTYDQTGELETVTTNAHTFTFHYDADHRKIERDDPNGLLTKYTYDANGRLKSWVTTQGSAAGAPLIDQGSYTLNAAGQRTALAYQAPDGNPRNLAWTYDGAGRLIGATRSLPAHDTNWTLDAVGNRTAQAQDGQTSHYGYDVTDRLSQISGAQPATYTWDANGQLQSKTDAAGTTSYHFNARHQLTEVDLPSGTEIDYTYAADGNLQSRTETASGGTPQTTHYLVDPNLPFAQVVAEYDDAGHATAIYVYGNQLLLRIAGGTTTDYHHNGLGSIIALTDASGHPIATYGYDAWGNPVEHTGSDPNPYRYAGERDDAATGLIYLRARWYDPALGRFVSIDPSAGRNPVPSTLAKYGYAGGDPINMLDRSGRAFSMSGLGAAMGIGAILGAAATPVYNYAIGKATTLGDVLKGAAIGAGVVGIAYVGGPIIATGLAGLGTASNGALVYDVYDDPGSTWGQRVAASALLLAAVAGPVRTSRFAGEMWGRPKTINDYRVLHDLGVGRVKAFFEANGFKVAREVYVRNPYYKVGRRYDLVVKDSKGRFIGIEYKGTQNAASNPPRRQVQADGWIGSHGGEMFGSAADRAGFKGYVTKVIRLGPDTPAEK